MTVLKEIAARIAEQAAGKPNKLKGWKKTPAGDKALTEREFKEFQDLKRTKGGPGLSGKQLTRFNNLNERYQEYGHE